MEVMDAATVPPVNISTDSIPTSEKKKKRQKPRRSENSKTTISIADDNFKGVSLEKAIAQISPCLKSSTGFDGTVDSCHFATFEDTIPKEKTITTDNDSFKGVSVENVKAERIDSQHHTSFEDKLSKEDSCLKSLVCNDGTDLEHNTVTACLASSEKKKKWKQKRIINCELLEGDSLVQNGLKQDNKRVKTSTERSVRMDSEGEKSGPVLGFVAEKDEQELKTKYNSSENHGLDHVILDSVGESGPGQCCSLFAVASLDSTDIKKKSLEPGPLNLNKFEKRCSFKKCRDSPLEATVLDSTNIRENSHSPGVAEICKRWKTNENDFKFSNSENSSLSFKDSIGHTSHFPDETITCQESLVGIDSECHVLTTEPSCFEKKERERKMKKSIACESINKICYLQDSTSAENNLTDHNEIDCVMQDNCCVVRQDVIDVHHLDKGCQDCSLEVTVLDSADIVNKSVSLGFTDVESSEKDRGDSLFNVQGLDSNDIKEKMASSGMTFKNFEGDCRDFNLDIEVLNTTTIKEKSFTSGEPSSVIERANTGFMNAHGGHAEVNNTLLESRGTKAYKKRETDRNYLVNQVKFSNLRNSSNSYEGRTGGTSSHQLNTMYAGDLLKRKLESRDLGVHALSEKISEDKLNKKAQSNCSGDGHISKGKKEGMEISLAENSCTQSYLKHPSKLSVSEASFKQKCFGKLERARITKHESFHIVDGLNLMDNDLNNFSESDPLCGSSKSKRIQIETMMDEAPSSHLGELKDDPDLDTVTKMDDLSLILNPSPERYLAVDSRKKLLILDINGLLVDFVSYFPIGHTPDIVISKKAVFKRPYCDEFLQFCFDRFNVGVWSSRTKRNIDMVVEFLMSDSMHKLLFCWDQSHCTDTGYKTIENREKPLLLKELRKLWDKCDPELPWEKGQFNETNTLLLDDSPYKSLLNPAYTAVFPNSYTYHQTNDSSLGPDGDLRIYLEGLAIAENVQKYVEQNPFGQRAITKSNPSWNFYCKIISGKI